MSKGERGTNDAAQAGTKKKLSCGLVMPISAIDGCTAEHWQDVKSIVEDAVEEIAEPLFEVRLVSDADDVGVIQKRIVQNLYLADLVICDVSAKNPNVMFELGLRLAFDKPTVIIKDDQTAYSFDTAVIEHLTYPRDLRFNRISTFKVLLADKVLATYRAAQSDPKHSTFLKHFGTFQVAQLGQETVAADRLLISMVQDLQEDVRMLRRSSVSRGKPVSLGPAASVRSALQLYQLANPGCDLKELALTDAFIQEIESQMPRSVLEHFSSHENFRNFVHLVVPEVMKLDGKNGPVDGAGSLRLPA